MGSLREGPFHCPPSVTINLLILLIFRETGKGGGNRAHNIINFLAVAPGFPERA